jgi:hypothetical protein
VTSLSTSLKTNIHCIIILQNFPGTLMLWYFLVPDPMNYTGKSYLVYRVCVCGCVCEIEISSCISLH